MSLQTASIFPLELLSAELAGDLLVAVLLQLVPVDVLSVVLQSRLGHQLLLTDRAVELQGREFDLIGVEGGDLLGGGVNSGSVLLQYGGSLQVEIAELTITLP